MSTETKGCYVSTTEVETLVRAYVKAKYNVDLIDLYEDYSMVYYEGDQQTFAGYNVTFKPPCQPPSA